MKRYLTNNVGEIMVLCISVGLFYMAEWVLPKLDPSAGTFDLGILHILLFGAIAFFFGIFCVWVVFEVSFRVFNRYFDMELFDEAFEELRVEHQVFVTVAMVLGLFYLFVQCCGLAK